MGGSGRAKHSRAEIESWELELVRKVARAFRTTEKEDLQAELAGKLLTLKNRSPSGIRDWKAYATKFLYNKADNWIRRWRASEHKKVALLETTEEAVSEPYVSKVVLEAPPREPDLQIAFNRVWDELDPQLRALWEMLLEAKGNQTGVARRIGKHRNTVRLWVRKIQQLLKYHGFRESDPF
jgi:RNA polymerase sigma factor (sigma-70 family)